MSKRPIAPIDELHNKTMALADEAFYAKRKGQPADLQALYQQAFQYEKAAAMLLVNDYKAEPTRSVLFRSAASLLLNLPELKETDYRAAEQMVAFGLSGNPPVAIADELREVWADIQARYAAERERSFQQQADVLLARVRYLLQMGTASDMDKAWLSEQLERIEADVKAIV